MPHDFALCALFLFVFRNQLLSRERSPVLCKKRAHFSMDEGHELRLPVAYQRTRPGAADSRSQVAVHGKSEHTVSRYPTALDNTFSTNDNSCMALGLGLADQLEDGAHPSRYASHSGDAEAKVRRARSRSLPSNQLDARDSDGDQSDNTPENIQQRPCILHADISETKHQNRKEPKSADRQYRDQDAMSLLTGPDWTTTSAQLETTL